MKRFTLLLLLAVSYQLSVFGQGALTPPGPPEPTFKTLEQVEPRTPITNLPVTIMQSGSYFLTMSLTCVGCSNNLTGVLVQADHVTIDLGGFALIGVAGSRYGIRTVDTRTNLVVRNGTIRNWGDAGIEFSSSVGCRVERVQCVANGGGGFFVSGGSTVKDCTAEANGATGISADAGSLVVDCVAHKNSGGISVSGGTTVSRCVATENVNEGIAAIEGSTIIGCTSRLNDHGLGVIDSTAIDCTVTDNKFHGIVAGDRARVYGNLSIGNGIGQAVGAGVHVTGNRNHIEGNTVIGNARGIEVISGSNLIIKNTASVNPLAGATGSSNFVIAASNRLGDTNAVPLGVITDTNPWRNFSY